jgi:hypothetical protein
MNTFLTKSALSAAIALTLAACGGGVDVGGGGVAGIGGSGFTSSGSVTGFGSVFVNGVEFETSGTVFDIDDSGSGSQTDLAIGMIVTVNGTVNADGITGTATSISFDDQLQGPVSAITAVLADPDEENRSFTTLGTTVRINRFNTSFDVSATVNAPNFDFDGIKDGDHIEISGFFNAAGELVATRVELKATAFSTSNIVELKGTIAGLVSSTFTVSGVNVDASSATIDDLPGGLAEGASVEVKGTCSDSACSTLNATRVEGQSGFDDADKISVEGLITDFVSSSDFKINGISVNASNAILSPGTLVLRDGARVEVEGPISNNVIQALTVELRGGDAKVHATVSSSVDPATGIFEVTFTGNNTQPQTIAVTVTTATEMEGTVTVGNFVRVRGFENDAGGITATRVEDRDPDDVIVQGDLQSIIKDVSITVLGASFQIDDTPVNKGETDFENTADIGIPQDDFITAAPPGTLVKVKDRNSGGGGSPLNGIADEIDIETR